MDIRLKDICEHLLVVYKVVGKEDYYQCLICGGVFEIQPYNSLLIYIDSLLAK